MPPFPIPPDSTAPVMLAIGTKSATRISVFNMPATRWRTQVPVLGDAGRREIGRRGRKWSAEQVFGERNADAAFHPGIRINLVLHVVKQPLDAHGHGEHGSATNSGMGLSSAPRRRPPTRWWRGTRRSRPGRELRGIPSQDLSGSSPVAISFAAGSTLRTAPENSRVRAASRSRVGYPIWPLPTAHCRVPTSNPRRPSGR